MVSGRTKTEELSTLLGQLCASGVDFILVGGLAAVTQGAPITTVDIDIVPADDPENIQRLFSFLRKLHARYRGRPEDQVLHPSLDDLLAGGHCLLMTDLGPLDILGEIEQGLKYTALLDDSIEISFKEHRLMVLSLEAMIRIKQSSPRRKDQLVLPVLKKTLSALKK